MARLPPKTSPPAPNESPLDVPDAAPECDTHHYKTRVERVFNRNVPFTTGVTTRRVWLTPEQMHRTDRFDCKYGTFWVRINGAAEVTAMSVTVIWEIPGSEHIYSAGTTAVLADVITPVVAWSGPMPGRVAFDLTITATTTGVTFATVDIVARRPGNKFIRGNWFRDVTASPRPTRAVMPPVVRESEGGVRTRAPRCRPSAERRAPDREQTPAFHPFERLRASLGIDPQSPDYVSAQGSRAERVDDPEVAAFLEDGRFSSMGLLDRGFQRLSLGQTVQDAAMPVHFPADRASFLFRGPAFAAKWSEITGGMSHKRMPVARLDSILDSRGARGNRLKIGPDVTDLASTTDAVRSGGWKWSVPAPWFSPSQRLTWFFTALLDLLHATYDLLPTSLESGREHVSVYRWFSPGLPPVGTITKEEARRRLFSNTPDWRLELRELAGTADMGAIDQFAYDPLVGAWNVAQMPDGVSVSDKLAREYWSPWTPNVHMYTNTIIPFVQAAASSYALARVLAMLAANYGKWLRNFTVVLDRSGPTEPGAFVDGEAAYTMAAAHYYRMHLGTLMLPARVLLHEIFHLDGRLHCESGCGQERMAANWVALVGKHFQATAPIMTSTTNAIVPSVVVSDRSTPVIPPNGLTSFVDPFAVATNPDPSGVPVVQSSTDVVIAGASTCIELTGVGVAWNIVGMGGPAPSVQFFAVKGGGTNSFSSSVDRLCLPNGTIDTP